MHSFDTCTKNVRLPLEKNLFGRKIRRNLPTWPRLDVTPPNPINHVCSLTGKSILKKHFTYRSVQIFKIIFRRFLISRIWSSAQDHAVLVFLLNLVAFFISTWPRWSGGNVLYHSCTSFKGASRGGQPLNIFTWFIGAGGSSPGVNISLGLHLNFWYLSTTIRHLAMVLRIHVHTCSIHIAVVAIYNRRAALLGCARVGQFWPLMCKMFINNRKS